MDRSSWEKSDQCGAKLIMSVTVEGQLQWSYSCPRCSRPSTYLNPGPAITWYVLPFNQKFFEQK